MKRGNIRYNYNGLWKLLIDKRLKKKDLIVGTGVSSSTIAKMTKEQPVNLEVIARICVYLNCSMNDVLQLEFLG